MIITEKWLREEYLVRNRTFADLCSETELSRSALWRLLARYDISKVSQKRSITKEWLRRRYIDDLAPIEIIASEAKCSVDTVKSWASIWGFERGQQFKLTSEGRKRHSHSHSEDSRLKMSRSKTKANRNYIRGKILGGHERRYLHRIIAAEILGRELTNEEIVHHIDCTKTNHHPENLLVIDRFSHAALHIVMRRRPDLNQVFWLRENNFNVEVLKDANYHSSPTFREWLARTGG